MGEAFTVEVKNAKREFFRLRGRFLKLQRTIVGEALLEAAAPIVSAAKSKAPTLKGTKKGRIPGLLRARIAAVLLKPRGTRSRVSVTPTQTSKREKTAPFYGRFIERGWKATGSANRRTAKNPRAIPGKHFLRDAGTQNFRNAERIFSARIFQRFAEIQEAGVAAGLV